MSATAASVEPVVEYARLRDAFTRLHIDCWFSDGSKSAAVQVGRSGEAMAHHLANMLPLTTVGTDTPVPTETVTMNGVPEFVIRWNNADGRECGIFVNGGMPGLAARVAGLVEAARPFVPPELPRI